MSLLGLDIGTAGCKAVAFTLEGQALAGGYREYPLSYPAPGRCELDVDTVWQAVVDVIREVGQAVGETDPVIALSMSALGDAVTPVDADGAALTPSVVGSPDRRAIEQAEWIERALGKQAVFQTTGVPVHAMCALPKIMWFKQHAPEVYRRAWKFVGWQELIQIKLGLEPACDYSQAGRSMAVDIHTRAYARDLLSTCDVDVAKLPRLATADTVVGRLDDAHAGMLGLRPGVIVTAGGFDHACAALGRGVVEPGAASLSLGTIELITAVGDEIRLAQSLLDGSHGCGFHVVPDRYISLAYIITAGAILRWFRDTIAVPERQHAEAHGIDPYDLIIDQTPDRPSEVYVLPYFAGTGTPWIDARQKGAVFGLELDTDRAEMAKGILDGLCYELRLNLESLRDSGFAVSTLRAMGGGSKSARWMQLKADITRTAIETARIHEAGCLGAALLAGLGAGIYDRPGDMLARVGVKTEAVYQPRPAVGAIYEQPFHTYCELRDRVKGLAL
jgi:xylulokinase